MANRQTPHADRQTDSKIGYKNRHKQRQMPNALVTAHRHVLLYIRVETHRPIRHAKRHNMHDLYLSDFWASVSCSSPPYTVHCMAPRWWTTVHSLWRHAQAQTCSHGKAAVSPAPVQLGLQLSHLHNSNMHHRGELLQTLTSQVAKQVAQQQQQKHNRSSPSQ